MIEERDRVEEMLAAFGGLYTFDDILAAIQSGEMQSFVRNRTWIVTQINEYPRKRVLNIIVAVGDLNGVFGLQPEVVAFAREHGCEMLWTVARKGWLGTMTPGWDYSGHLYTRKL